MQTTIDELKKEHLLAVKNLKAEHRKQAEKLNQAIERHVSENAELRQRQNRETTVAESGDTIEENAEIDNLEQ